MSFNVIVQNIDIIFDGLKNTFFIFSVAYVVGLVIGLFSAALRMSPIAPLRWLVTGYVEFMRNTPLLVQVFFVYLALPIVVGVRMTGIQSVILTLALNNGAYLSEIIRGGLQSIPKGQLEAAASLGLSPITTFFDIVFPQALRAIFPSLVNQMIATLLGSAIGTIIGAPELTQQINFLNSRTYRTIELLLFLSMIYAVLTFILTQLSKVISQRFEWQVK